MRNNENILIITGFNFQSEFHSFLLYILKIISGQNKERKKGFVIDRLLIFRFLLQDSSIFWKNSSIVKSQLIIQSDVTAGCWFEKILWLIKSASFLLLTILISVILR